MNICGKCGQSISRIEDHVCPMTTPRAKADEQRLIEQGLADAQSIVGAPRHHATDTVEMAQLAITLSRLSRPAAPPVLETLASAMQKFAPDLAKELARRWGEAMAKEDAALDEILRAALGKEV